MKTLFSSLLAAALLTGLAFSFSFRCYTCKTKTADKDADCLVDVLCKENQYCQTIVTIVNGTKSISKNCESNCVSPTPPPGNVTFTFLCCDGNLCNVNAAGGVRASSAVLSLAVGLSLYLFG